MGYEMEELLPVVAKLARKYTGDESTSITYEKAEQFMEAVLYCMNELDRSGSNSVVPGGKIPAQQAYENGYKAVIRKARQALELYHDVLHGFTDYGNHCLYDTVIRGIPEFFKWYDAEFEPQNTVLTLDYPVLKDLSSYTGVDRIYEFLCCIRAEKMFLGRFPETYVRDVLRNYDCQYQDMIENVCEIVFGVVICHVLVEKPLSEQDFSEAEEAWIRRTLFQMDREEARNQLAEVTRLFVENYYGNDAGLLEYLAGAFDHILLYHPPVL